MRAGFGIDLTVWMSSTIGFFASGGFSSNGSSGVAMHVINKERKPKIIDGVIDDKSSSQDHPNAL